MGYVNPVWQLIPYTLADKLEQALRVIIPSIESHNEALQRAQQDSLARHFLTLQYMDKIKVKGHPLHHLPKRVSTDCLYGPRNRQDSL